MNKTGFFVLTAVTAALIVGTVAFQPAATTVNLHEGARFFPNLDPKTVNAVDRIRITAKGEKFTLVRKDGKWLAEEKDGYPVQFAKVKEALFSLAQLMQLEKKTSDKTRYSALDLEDPAEKGASSKRLTAYVGKNQVADVIVGKSNSKELLFGRSLVYIRLPKEQQAWLAVGDPKLAADVGEWLDRTLFDVATSRVKQVIQTDAQDGKVIVGKDKPEGTNFKLRNKPEGREVKGPRFVRYIGEGLTNVSLEDVQPASKIDFKKSAAGSVRSRTFDGLVVTVNIAKVGDKKDEKYWLTFQASVDEEALLKKKPGKDSKLKSAEEVRKEAAAINEKTKGWAYQVSSTVIRFMRYTMGDLLKPAPKKPVEDAVRKTTGSPSKQTGGEDAKKVVEGPAKKVEEEKASPEKPEKKEE